MMLNRLFTVVFAFGLVPALASAQQPGTPGAPSAEKLEWGDSWHRANWWDGGVVIGGFSIFLVEELLLPRPDKPSWDDEILFDGPVRDLLRAHSKGDRATMATISDVMLAGSLFHNMIFDNMVVALALHRKPDVAWQMSVINAEAYALTFSITGLIKHVAGRARPFVRECAEDPEYSDSCGAETAARSFYSGHAATTATGAGLLCAHHLNLPLYDGEILDKGVCGLGIALTIATAAMRISADRHWASDVLTGHLIGFSAGYFIPTLLYYTEPDEEPADTVLLPDITPEQVGVRVMGRM